MLILWSIMFSVMGQTRLDVIGMQLRFIVGKYKSMMLEPSVELEIELIRNSKYLKAYFKDLRCLYADAIEVSQSISSSFRPDINIDVSVPSESVMVAIQVPRTIFYSLTDDEYSMVRFFQQQTYYLGLSSDRTKFNTIDIKRTKYSFHTNDVKGRPSPWYKCNSDDIYFPSSKSINVSPFSSCWIYADYVVFEKKPTECCMKEIQDYVRSWLNQCGRLKHFVHEVESLPMTNLVNYSVSMSESVPVTRPRRSREETVILRLPGDAHLTLYCGGSRLMEFQVNKTQTFSFSMTSNHTVTLSHPPGVIDLPWVQVIVETEEDCELWSFDVAGCKSTFETQKTDCVQRPYNCALRRRTYACVDSVSFL